MDTQVLDRGLCQLKEYMRNSVMDEQPFMEIPVGLYRFRHGDGKQACSRMILWIFIRISRIDIPYRTGTEPKGLYQAMGSVLFVCGQRNVIGIHPFAAEPGAGPNIPEPDG